MPRTKRIQVNAVDEWVTTKTKIIPRLGRVPEITAILPRLYLDQPISNAIEGKNAYFVVCLTDKQAPRKAELKEVKDKVTKAYKEAEALIVAKNMAEKAYGNINELLTKGKNITDSKTTFRSIPEFSQKNYMPLLKVKDGIKVYDLVMKTEKGKVSKPTETKDGAILVYLQNVKMPSEKDFNKVEVMKEYKTV